MWDKQDGVQAHHVIQSFDPNDDITAEQANELGRQLAEQIAPGHEAAVYTHTDKEHIHNHIVINAVSFETGRKFEADMQSLYRTREASDKLCMEHGLSVVNEHTQQERLTMAERQMRDRGEIPWKDRLKNAIDEAKDNSKSLDGMKDYLQQNYGIEMKIQNKNVSFLYPEHQKYCRGKTLGEAYTKETLIKELSQDRGQEQKPGIFSRPIQGTTAQSVHSEQPSQQAHQQSTERYQKGIDALRGLSQSVSQQQTKIPQQERTQGQQKYRNKRAKSRMEQQRQGPTLGR